MFKRIYRNFSYDNSLYVCESTDIKPTEDMKYGDKVREIDTGLDYIFNGSAWVEQVTVTDLTTYTAIIATLPADNSTDTYTTPSWTLYDAAIALVDVAYDASETQGVINKAVSAIRAALDLLVLTSSVDTDAYDALVLTVPADNNAATYTAESWTLFAAAIAEADLTLTAVDGQEAIDAEIIVIQDALDLLEATPEE